jgi:hypothetical protein
VLKSTYFTEVFKVIIVLTEYAERQIENVLDKKQTIATGLLDCAGIAVHIKAALNLQAAAIDEEKPSFKLLKYHAPVEPMLVFFEENCAENCPNELVWLMLDISLARLIQTSTVNINKLETTLFPEDLPFWFELVLKLTVLAIRTEHPEFVIKANISFEFVSCFDEYSLRSFYKKDVYWWIVNQVKVVWFLHAGEPFLISEKLHPLICILNLLMNDEDMLDFAYEEDVWIQYAGIMLLAGEMEFFESKDFSLKVKTLLIKRINSEFELIRNIAEKMFVTFFW